MSVKIEIEHFSQDKREHQDFVKKDEPGFVSIKPDIERIREVRENFEYENLVVIGNGGSITSFRAYLYAFLGETDVNVRLVTTMDPDYLNNLTDDLEPENTVVMPISKSGETVGVIESLMHFVDRDYPVCAVTSENDGALKQIVERNDYGFIEHQDVGGRFSGLTETALAPALFAGIDVEEIREGGEEMYEKLSPKMQYNPALNVASALYDAEKEGYREIFTPFYSTRLFGFYPLFVQLMHETVCKDGEGQTVYGDMGPECQHHTNQRLFGGRKDVATMFFRTEAHEKSTIDIPDNLSDIEVRGRKLSELDKQSLGSSLEAEYKGVKEALEEEDMPNITVNLTDVSHRTLGKLVAFMQYLAVYSAWLRDVEPFNQPDVEKSKQIGFEERFK
jgi:glucose-6-phosphate isomerase